MDLKKYDDRMLKNQLKAAKSKNTPESKEYAKQLETELAKREGLSDPHADKGVMGKAMDAVKNILT